MAMPMPGAPVGDFTDVAANLGAILSATSLDELRARIDAILAAEKKRVVVIMDDIDRLETTGNYNVTTRTKFSLLRA